MQETLWIACVVAFSIAGIAVLGDRRRARRTNLDAVGFMPWPLIMILAMLIAAICAAFALRLH